jgi:hypothetical protein
MEASSPVRGLSSNSGVSEVVDSKKKGTVYPITGLVALKGVGGQHHAPAALPPGKTRYPLYRRLGGPQGRPGCVQKISPPPGIRSPDRPAHSQSL